MNRSRLGPLAEADEVPVLKDRTWLFTGAEGPALRVHAEAFQAYLDNRNDGQRGRDAHDAVEARLRQRLAAMLGLDCEDIAIVSNASEAMNLVALVLDLGPGDNVVVNDFEYPSVVLPWLRLAERGVEVRVAHRHGWTMPPASSTRPSWSQQACRSVRSGACPSAAGAGRRAASSGSTTLGARTVAL